MFTFRTLEFAPLTHWLQIVMENDLILDVGSYSSKVGTLKDEGPTVVRSQVGGPRRRYADQLSESIFIGDEMTENAAYLSVISPFQRGDITNYDMFEKLLGYTLGRSRDDETAGGHCVQSYPFECPIRQNQFIGEYLFEQHGFDSLQQMSCGALSLFANGVQTGLGVEMGHGVCQVTPISSGYMDKGSIKRFDVSGEDIELHLQLLMSKGGYQMTKSCQIDLLDNIKKRFCYVSVDPNAEDIKDVSVPMMLPDGHPAIALMGTSQLDLQNELYWAPEVLFNPKLTYHPESEGITQQLWASIRNCSMNSRRGVMQNIVLSGGTSMLEGMQARLLEEMRNSSPDAVKDEINVTISSHGDLSVWQGGKIMCDVETRSSVDQFW
eukprot:GHVH01003299.1.p1 GENE.GHVH01003299.1~~GHVH01003299.1.p1  ORF type:complete len:380 (+),score=52.52 GHVH01003299.1:293-1432(+)